MKVLIIYKSYHRMNTEMVAKAMAETMSATLIKVEDARIEDLTTYDLVGFGSGIYAGKPHRALFKFIEKMPPMIMKAFIFSTSGGPKEQYHQLLREKLTAKGCQVVGEFQCAGKSGFLGFDFANKGHPDEKDLQDARTFAKSLLSS